jgi:hypothetical protein
MAATGSWGKSKVTEALLSPFLLQGNIIARNYRIPKTIEMEPAPQASEYVTFISHLERGFGTPSSLFFRRFCAFYRIKSSDLGPIASSRSPSSWPSAKVIWAASPIFPSGCPCSTDDTAGKEEPYWRHAVSYFSCSGHETSSS